MGMSHRKVSTNTAYIVVAYIIVAYIVMVYIVMAYTVMGYIVMAYIVMTDEYAPLQSGHKRAAVQHLYAMLSTHACTTRLDTWRHAVTAQSTTCLHARV